MKKKNSKKVVSMPKVYKGFQPLKYAIKNKAVEGKMQKYLNKAMVLKIWPTVAEGFALDFGSQTKATDYKNGILYIACLSKETAYQIKLLTCRIIEILNFILGKSLVFAINIEV